MMALEYMLFDFGRDEAAAGWGSISDTVMGGISTAEFVPSSDASAISDSASSR